MTDYEPDSVNATPASAVWPLTPFVHVQLAVAAVWVPYVVGVLILLPVAGLALLLGGVATGLVNNRAAFFAAVGAGALLTARAMPRVWPAARQLRLVRRVLACILGPAAAQLLGAGALALGIMPAKGSMDPMEMATIGACALGGGCVSWITLLQQGQA